ncbi:MAG TPA: response regulator transcription factor [Gemmatimonadaceae bacterium]|nr:response regulator transcription factor [Gemmatimonadaceae bacterium]
MADRTALIIDDEPRIRSVVRNALAPDFSKVVEAATAEEALDLIAKERPGLIVLDLGLPDMSGVAVCERIRQRSDALILVLSARHADREKATLLDAGADDYVTKPFSTIELTARVRALRRRAKTPHPEETRTVSHGELTMDFETRTVVSSGRDVHLTPIEWELLSLLITNAGKTLTHRQIFNAVWSGRQFGDAQQYLRVHVANLRRKIETNPLDPRYIVTEPGVGYRFAAPARVPES